MVKSASAGETGAATAASNDSKAAGHQSELEEAARRAAYVQQYQAMLAQVQAEKQEKIKQVSHCSRLLHTLQSPT
jgi:hypothetical protein